MPDVLTIFDHSTPGKNRIRLPEINQKAEIELPEKMMNTGLDLPDAGEAEVVRHYTALSRMNFGVDNGIYPLGSCTMKYNPKINESLATEPGFTDIHPLCGEELSQGTLQVLFDLSKYLCEITGMHAFSLMPAAGSHGELTSVMIIRKYFEDIGQSRDVILIPDSAHGTNPASVAMCGFKVRQVPSDKNGNVDCEALEKLLDDHVAAMMLTSPNTLGLFDSNILKISEMLHRAGALFYCDGANLNAVMGKARISDMGFDIMHINLHKTFSTPHGGGGPGSGPIGVVSKLEKYLPVPVIARNKDTEQYFFDNERPASIGRVHSYYGNFLVAIKAYAYIRSLGPEGIKEAAEYAVLNANYLRVSLKDIYNLPIDRICMHEFVLNDDDLSNNITTNDIAKRLLDFSMHAPTVYFPLLVHGAIMIEPTETENKNELDRFISVMRKIHSEAENNPEMLHNAPHSTPVKRVDAVTAARVPILTWDEYINNQ